MNEREKVYQGVSFPLFQEFTEHNSFFRHIYEDLPKKARSLVESLYVYDRNVVLHSARVSQLAYALAVQTNKINPQILIVLASTGIVHDVGKMTIDYSILNKVGKHTQEERNIIMQHVRNGFTLLNDVDGLDPLIPEIMVSHHEYGESYPRNLMQPNNQANDREKRKSVNNEQEQIRIAKKLLQITDYIDGCLDETRPYRQHSLSLEDVKTNLLNEFGYDYFYSIHDDATVLIDKALRLYKQLFQKSGQA